MSDDLRPARGERMTKAKAAERFREAVMQLARDLHEADCWCPKVPGVYPPAPYRSGWVDLAIGEGREVLSQMEEEGK